MRAMTCAELGDCSAELALGVLPGAERAGALLHLQTCLACRLEVQSLAGVSDALLELMPAADPPLGFESRVAARLTGARRRRRRRWMPAVAAAGAVAFAAGGWALGSATSSPGSRSHQVTAGVTSAELAAGSRTVGRVFLYSGSPGWVFMTVDSGRGSGTVTCFLTKRDGSSVRVGSFALAHGYGYWGAAVRVDPVQVTGARLVAGDGSVLASASIPGL